MLWERIIATVPQGLVLELDGDVQLPIKSGFTSFAYLNAYILNEQIGFFKGVVARISTRTIEYHGGNMIHMLIASNADFKVLEDNGRANFSFDEKIDAIRNAQQKSGGLYV